MKLKQILTILIILSFVTPIAWGAYTLTTAGTFSIDHASLLVDGDPIDVYIASVAPGGTSVITQASPYTYIVSVNGATYYANSTTGGTNYSDANATTVWQSAIDACEVSGGGIYAKAGNYSIDTGLTITEPVTIDGEGGEWEDTARGTILTATGTITAIIEINIDETGVTALTTGGSIRNIFLDGNWNADVGLLVTSAIRFSAEGLTAYQCNDWGLWDKYNHSHHYSHCRFTGNGANGTGDAPATGGAKFGIVAGSEANTVLLDGCSFESNQEVGLYVARSEGFEMNECIIEDNYSFGFILYDVNGFLANGLYTEHNSDVTGQVSANKITGGAHYTFTAPLLSESNAVTYSLDASAAGQTIIIGADIRSSKTILKNAATGSNWIGNPADFT